MKKTHWIDFLTDSNAIQSIFKDDNVIPPLNNIKVEYINLGLNLNSLQIYFYFSLPENSPKKMKLKNYNILNGDLNFLNISQLKVKKENLYQKQENYTFTFKEIDNKTLIEIEGSLGSQLKFNCEYITLLNFRGSWIE